MPPVNQIPNFQERYNLLMALATILYIIVISINIIFHNALKMYFNHEYFRIDSQPKKVLLYKI